MTLPLSFKGFPDTFNAPSRAEFQHQFDPRLMAREHSAQDRAHLSQLATRALVSISVEHAPARAARCDDDRNAGLDARSIAGKAATVTLPRPRPSITSPRAPSSIAKLIKRPSAPATILITSTRSSILSVTMCSRPSDWTGRRVDDHAVFVHDSERAEIAALESVCRFGVGLGGFGGGDQLVVHRDDHAEAARLRVNGHANGRTQIPGPVPAQLRTVAHRADEDYRLLLVQNQVEQICRLFERVGAVRDDRARDAFVGELLPRRAGQFHHPRRRDVRAGPFAEIDHVEIGDLDRVPEPAR